ncbi:hypothetical protein [Hyunsoonleella aquatilis]|nr:hypothetical protein [Hyunsoonleella aquatilis]
MFANVIFVFIFATSKWRGSHPDSYREVRAILDYKWRGSSVG